MWDLIAGERDHVLITDFFHRHIRQYVAIGLGRKNLARFWVKSCDEIGGLLHLVDRYPKASGDVRIPLTAQVVQILVEDLVFKALCFTESPQLDEQAIFKISRPDPNRMEGLHQFQGLPQFFNRGTGKIPDFVYWRGKKTNIINVSDQELGGLSFLRVDISSVQ